jgi:type IV pilus assembly protein PilM
MLQINLKSVMIGCNCITKVLLADSKIKAKMPLLAVQIDNNFISLNLYEKGQLSFSRFASISAEDYDDSEDYVFEAVNENIFRMLQFQKSKPGSEMIENVVFYGDTHEYVRLTNELEKMGIRTSIINVPPQIHGYENLEFSSYANAIGAMFKRNKETERINLLETDTVNNNKIRSDSSYLVMLGISAAASAVLVGLAFAFLSIQNAGVEKDINTLNAKIESQLAQDLDAQLAMLTKKQTAVNTYVDGVTDAYYAFLSRPKPASKQYEEIEQTFNKTIATVFECDEDEAKEKYEISTMNYSNGTFSVSVTFDREDTLVMPTLPEKLVSALRALSDVQSVNYTGYSLREQTVKLDEDEAKAAAAAAQADEEEETDEDGNPVEKKPAVQKNDDDKDTEIKRTVEMNMSIVMKGGDFNLDDLRAEEKEAE